MKKTIRDGVFETNSSSTHSICIAKNAELTIPESIHFGFNRFGWEHDTLKSLDEKAQYLYTGLIANDRNDDFIAIIDILKSKNIDVTFEMAIYSENESGRTYIENGGYVDHANELETFLNDICSDENKLMQYLFSDLSFIITGNDNSEIDVSINVSYEHDEYYKGN